MKFTRQHSIANVRQQKFTTLPGLNLCAWVLLWVVLLWTTSVQADNTSTFPSFRHIDATSLEALTPIAGQIIVLADGDFAPWSFKNPDGTLQGISIDLAEAACREAKLNCTIIAKTFAELLPALRNGEAQLAISGVRPDLKLLNEFRLSKPYFRSPGRFVVREGSPLATPDIRTLAGKRLGFVRDTSHARFIETYYSRSALTPFATAAEMQDALRTGQIDVMFNDAIQVAFWLKGSDARNCCAVLGKAFMHRETFSRSLVFVGAKNQQDLMASFDAALDKLDTTSATSSIFSRYLPSSIW